MTARGGEGNVTRQAVEADGPAVDQLTTAATPLPICRCIVVRRLLEQRRTRARPIERVADMAAEERLP